MRFHPVQQQYVPTFVHSWGPNTTPFWKKKRAVGTNFLVSHLFTAPRLRRATILCPLGGSREPTGTEELVSTHILPFPHVPSRSSAVSSSLILIRPFCAHEIRVCVYHYCVYHKSHAGACRLASSNRLLCELVLWMLRKLDFVLVSRILRHTARGCPCPIKGWVFFLSTSRLQHTQSRLNCVFFRTPGEPSSQSGGNNCALLLAS